MQLAIYAAYKSIGTLEFILSLVLVASAWSAYLLHKQRQLPDSVRNRQLLVKVATLDLVLVSVPLLLILAAHCIPTAWL